MGIFQTKIKVINKFLSYFKSIFSTKQFIIFCYIIYAMCKDYRRLSLSSIAEITSIDYQRLQYFISEAKWSGKELNTMRLNLIERQRTTGSSPCGVLVIDDTGSAKPYAKHTEGAYYQYCPPLKREEVCNVAVFSAFSSHSKSFPVDFKFYLPEKAFSLGKSDPRFKSKLELAQELIDQAVGCGIKFSHIVFDSWYGNSSCLLEYVDEIKELSFITELRDNRKLQFYHPLERKHIFLQANELVKFIRKVYPLKLKPLRLSKDCNNGQPALWYYSFKSKLFDCSVPVKVVVVFGKLFSDDPLDAHIFVSNDLSLSGPGLAAKYRLRWGIERIFQVLKDVFSFDHYQLRFKTQIERFWYLCLIVWSLVYFLKQNNYLGYILADSVCLDSFYDYKKALNSLITFDSFAFLSKNTNRLREYFPIKSKRFLKTYSYALK